MSLQSIRSLNFFATLAAGHISLIPSGHRESIFLKELKECSKRIYGVPKFIFYALGYAPQHHVWYCEKNKEIPYFMRDLPFNSNASLMLSTSSMDSIFSIPFS